MALPDLASVTDLSDRGVTLDEPMAGTMLAVASSSVRRAAGSPILDTTSTVELTGWGERSLVLPGPPVRAVEAVLVDDSPAGAYRLVDSHLWRRTGWGSPHDPVSVAVTYRHGHTEVPADIVQLVCDLAILGASTAEDGAMDPRVVTESIDDYAVRFAPGAESVASVMELPALTRRWLAARYGGTAAMVAFR